MRSGFASTIMVVALGLVAAAALPALTMSHTLPHARVTVAAHPFDVEVASTQRAIEHGLMKRRHLASNAGMWFVFERAKPRAFWMKNTRIPLDILFFDASQRLVSVQLDATTCRAAPCRLYPSGLPIKYVLEVPAGTARRLRIGAGATAHVQSVDASSAAPAHEPHRPAGG